MVIGMQWIIFIGVAVVSWLVQMNLQNKFKKYSQIPTGNGMTGADVSLGNEVMEGISGGTDAEGQPHHGREGDFHPRPPDGPLQSGGQDRQPERERLLQQ